MNPATGVASLGHIEQRSAARNLVDHASRPTFYIPPRIQKTEKSSNVFKGASFTGCTYTNGFLHDSVLSGCIIDGKKNKLRNLDLDFTNIDVEGLATINQLKVTRVGSNLIPIISNTYNVGSASLKWNYLYGRYFDACYGYYLGETNHFSMIRISDSSDTLITNAMGDIIFDTTTTDKGTIFRLGTDTSATYFQVQNNSGTALFNIDGSGQVDIGGNLDVSGGIDIDVDNQSLTIGAGADYSISHDGTDSTITTTTGDLITDNTNTTGSTIQRLGTDTNVTSFQVQNNSESIVMKAEADGMVDIPQHNASSIGLKLGGTLVTSSATELNVIDGDTSGSSVTLLDTDYFVVNDGGIMKQVPVSDMKTYIQVWLESDTIIYPVSPEKTIVIGSNAFIDEGDTTNILEITGKTKTTGRILCCDETDATTTSDGSIYTEGGLSVVKNAVFGANVYASSFIMTSDRRLKKQIKELDKEHSDDEFDERFDNLEPVKFKWRKQAHQTVQPGVNIIKKEKYNYGLIAQNVMEEFPECAVEKPDGYMGIDYMGLTSVLLLKLQKQNKIIKEQKSSIEYVESAYKKQEIVLNNVLQRMEKLEANDTDSTGSQQISRSWNDYDRDYMRDRRFDRDNSGCGGGGGAAKSC
jgi:hypothetical protein